MEFHIFHFFTLLSVLFVASHAALTSEDYWKSVLPNTPMPKAISELLPAPELMDDKSTAVTIGKGSGVGVNTGKATNVGVGKGGVAVRSGSKGKPVYVGVKPGPDPFIYNYAATADQLNDNPNAALFFLEKDISQGKNMNLYFTKSTTPSTFLPQNVANSIPFSSKKIPQILNQLSVNPNSYEAETIANTIKECEAPAIKGEKKLCATSLESMIEFSTLNLGKKVAAVSTDVQKETEMQKYRIVGSKKLGEKAVVCHKQNYAYAVFYCHKTDSVKAYTVSLVGSDGTKAKAAAICHTDTSSWNPKHVAFQVLKVEPGSVPVCHYLPEDHVLWAGY